MVIDRKLKRVVSVLLYALFLLLLVELGSRAFWKARGAPFFTAHRNLDRSFYPQLSQVKRAFSEEDEERLDILILGGSVVHTDYGDIEHVLRERLVRATRRPVRIHNLSAPAHTSLDSYYKYKHLRDHNFDLVIVYHGINDIRANNCPASAFREDYGHLSWYRLINDYERRADTRWLIFPYTVKFVALKAAGRLGWSGFLPTHEPDAESMEYGCDVKTRASLRANLEGILELAARKNEPVLLMSFAFHMPEDYTRERFENLELDYTAHTFPAELWGKAECVVAGISAHNEAIEDLAGRYDQVLHVDQRKLIPREGRFFNDICHLTHEGCERFVDNLLDVILVLMERGLVDSEG